MSRDYAKKNRPQNRRRASQKDPVPAWIWLLVGGFLGAFIMFLIYLSDITPTKTPVAKAPPKQAVKTRAEDEQVPKPRFDFYKLLQESEVIVPATEAVPSVEKTASTPSQDVMEYLLQVGSFRSGPDADKLRAQLILLNLDAHIEKVTIRNDELWHRVIVGPFKQQAQLDNARSTLVANQYNALVLKRKENSAP